MDLKGGGDLSIVFGRALSDWGEEEEIYPGANEPKKLYRESSLARVYISSSSPQSESALLSPTPMGVVSYDQFVPVSGLMVLLCCCLSLLRAVVLVLSCACMPMIAPDIPSLPLGLEAYEET